VLGGEAGGPRSGYRSLPDTITIVKAKGKRARRWGLPGSE